MRVAADRFSDALERQETRAITMHSCGYACADGRANEVSAAHLIWRDAAG